MPRSLNKTFWTSCTKSPQEIVRRHKWRSCSLLSLKAFCTFVKLKTMQKLNVELNIWSCHPLLNVMWLRRVLCSLSPSCEGSISGTAHWDFLKFGETNHCDLWEGLIRFQLSRGQRSRLVCSIGHVSKHNFTKLYLRWKTTLTREPTVNFHKLTVVPRFLSSHCDTLLIVRTFCPFRSKMNPESSWVRICSEELFAAVVLFFRCLLPHHSTGFFVSVIVRTVNGIPLLWKRTVTSTVDILIWASTLTISFIVWTVVYTINTVSNCIRNCRFMSP